MTCVDFRGNCALWPEKSDPPHPGSQASSWHGCGPVLVAGKLRVLGAGREEEGSRQTLSQGEWRAWGLRQRPADQAGAQG